MGALTGKIAIVTGAGRGIGRGHALLLAAEGASVVVNDLGASEPGGVGPAQAVVDEIVAAGGSAVANESDVSSWQGAEQLVNQAIETYGDLHVLVNNAGVTRDAMSFSMTEEAWDFVIAVDLKGHAAPTRFAAAYWREQSKAGAAVNARIINTTSEAALWGNASQLNYVAAKAGIASMTITLARELERYGVTVNAVAPRARTALNPALGDVPESGFDQWHPDNVAPFITWLASDDARDVSGQVFIAGGGSVYLLSNWAPVGEIHQDHAWSIDELAKRRGDLFGDRSVSVPAFVAPGF